MIDCRAEVWSGFTEYLSYLTLLTEPKKFATGYI